MSRYVSIIAMATLIRLSIAFIIVSVANGLHDERCVHLEDNHRAIFRKQIKEQYPSLFYQCELEGAALDFIESENFEQVKKDHSNLKLGNASITRGVLCYRININDKFENLVLYAFDNLHNDLAAHNDGKSSVGCNYQYNLYKGNEIACVFA
ncbi:unnamed protein product [Cylicocyclus nassatus]|uniref:Uncharacterized protein n=1 Tax=Cylicocyclus nassatus TaxID=53992 RepID=A0AA36GJC5_CYLNA|nr:unnamed protein product [Cylicocyclus nassatus]